MLPAGNALPHTRTRPTHWFLTAAALAVVTGGAALIEPAGATAPAAAPAPGPAAGDPEESGENEEGGGGEAAEEPLAPVAAPDPEAAEYPVDCGPLAVVVTDQVEVDVQADGRSEAVAVVRCDAGSGSPPNGVYLLTAPAEADAPPTVAGTLVDPTERMTVERLEVRGSDVAVRLLGYSSPDVPSCCPDLSRDITWTWRDGRLEPHAAPVDPDSV
ncbi:hypothetical protein E1265_12735 [Streptomyces sp. 8K308]|uniref:hypothetical protein n=1 Tax=Streptomyces sp. 8K308 TaxID=2530388 RepID=UPI001047E55F|nr:hypothetical protein [Streptomyces sp. 8K308]TDC23467.1 hypothetical protein E1265_12735 [Streptomyces sp. 8K308]